MKHILSLIAFIAILVTIPVLSGCNGGVDIFGTKVEVVETRNPDGTIKPMAEIKNSLGESPNAYATVYNYPSGIGVSAWYGNTRLAGTAPKLSQ